MRPRRAARRAVLAILATGATVAVAVAGALAAAAATHHSTATAGATTTTVFHPLADGRVEEAHASAAYGTDRRLGTDGDVGARVETDLRFAVGGLTGTVTSAKLRLYVVSDGTKDGPAVYPATGTWSETTLTWNTRATATAAAVADYGGMTASTWAEIDVTPAVPAGGAINLVLTQPGTDGAVYYAREKTDFQPELVVTTTAPTTTTTTPSSTTSTTTTVPTTTTPTSTTATTTTVPTTTTPSSTTSTTAPVPTTTTPSSTTSTTTTVPTTTTPTSTTATTTTTTPTTTAADTTPPTAPTGLAVTSSTTSGVSVSWTASTDDIGVAAYGTYVDGTSVGSSAQTSYTFTRLLCGTSYVFAVDAADAAGNRSGTTALTATTAACPDRSPPSAPTNLAATGATTTSIALSWTVSTDDVGVTGYDVYRDASLDGTTASASYTVANLTCGTTYTFAVDAKDAAGNVSSKSAPLTMATAPCPTAPDPLITAAGDICSTTTDCAPTAALIAQINPTRVLTLGDNAYNDGSLANYQTYYDPNWGMYKAKTSPTTGNHDFHVAGAADYFSYFGAAIAPAPYYSYDVGTWHLISLGSIAGVDPKAGGAEETWLKQDLAAHANKCVLAYWHEPRFSSGTTHGSSTYLSSVWNDLYAARADVVVNAHEHNYERFAKQNPSGNADPNGIREFVSGTGGASHGYPFSTPLATSEVRNDSTWGVLELTLHPASYDWKFVPIAGSTFTDSGSDTCN
jgi:acid phosphatase type 7